MSFLQQHVKCNFSGYATRQDDDIMAALWPVYNIVFPIIIISGVAGNIMNLMVLTRPTLRGVTYLYLSGLAVSDFGVMLTAAPVIVRFNKNQNLTYGRAFFHAHIELVFLNTFMAASVFIVCFMTVDRYFSVCLPTQFKSIHTKKNALLGIASSYTLGFIISCPLSIYKNTCESESMVKNQTEAILSQFSFQENISATHTLLWQIYIWICEPGMRLLPAAILAILNTLIILEFRKLARHQRKIRDDLGKIRRRLDTSERQSVVRYKLYLEEQRLVYLLTAIIITFVITMTPATLLSILITDHLDRDWGFQVFRAIANNLEVTNFALNFFIYFMCSRQFRKALYSFFHKSEQSKKNASLIELDTTRNGTSYSNH